MHPSLSFAVCIVAGITFGWLTWRSVWATVPQVDPGKNARQDNRSVLFWLAAIFYAGMASFELASNMGL